MGKIMTGQLIANENGNVNNITDQIDGHIESVVVYNNPENTNQEETTLTIKTAYGELVLNNKIIGNSNTIIYPDNTAAKSGEFKVGTTSDVTISEKLSRDKFYVSGSLIVSIRNAGTKGMVKNIIIQYR